MRDVIQTKNEVLSAQSMYVVKGNALIQKSRYSLSLTEQKAILFMISKIKPTDKPFTEYTFAIKDFCRACNFDEGGGFYIRYVRECINTLAKNVIVIDLGDKKTLTTHWFSSAIIDGESNTVQVVFDKNITPYLYELHSFYTQYSLEYVLPMKSKYGIRLYEYLRSIQSKGWKQKISLEELRERVDCDKYPNYKDFRRNVLEPAIEDINAFTDLDVSFEALKTGRKITHIEFIIRTYVDKDYTMDRFYNRRKVLGSIR